MNRWDIDEEGGMHWKSDNMKVMAYNKAEEIIKKKKFQSLVSRYQIGLETSIRASKHPERITNNKPFWKRKKTHQKKMTGENLKKINQQLLLICNMKNKLNFFLTTLQKTNLKKTNYFLNDSKRRRLELSSCKKAISIIKSY